MSVLSLNDKVSNPNIEKSTFDLDYVHSLTGHFGRLIPVYCEEVVPGDNFEITIGHIINILPLGGVINQRVDLFIHGFYVPNRIIWDEWEDFITGRSASTVPVEDLANGDILPGQIGDYLGIPQKSFGSGHAYVNTLPLRAYYKIWNDWYRNKVIQTEEDLTIVSYQSVCELRNWRKDYFTSAVPYPQLGNAATVQMDITLLDTATTTESYAGTNNYMLSEDSAGKVFITNGTINKYTNINTIDEISVDVNELRYAYAYQDWLVRMLKSGDDYSDHLKLVFGVNSSDARHQKAEYLGGYSSPIIVNEVTQQGVQYDANEEVVGTPLGSKGGTGLSYGDGRISCYCEEHGYIMIIASILPKSIHYGGLPRHFSKTVPLDFYFPQFAHLPEQEILNKEVYWKEAAADNDPFGYIERYAEYKHRNDQISGDMVKAFDHLHFANIYTDTMALNDSFLRADVREDAFAVQNSIHFYGQFGFNVKATRPMPFNVDGLNVI